MTLSITWIKPLEHLISVFTTFAVSIEITWSTLPTLMPSGWPLTVGVLEPVRPITFLPPSVPGTTCRVRIEVNLGISARRASIVPSGSFAKASSEGAKMVNLSPLRVSTRPHAVTAATRVWRMGRRMCQIMFWKSSVKEYLDCTGQFDVQNCEGMGRWSRILYDVILL